jgi:hypothetical protein
MSAIPTLNINNITIGVWKETPKISGMMIAKLSHSLRRNSGSTSSHSLNQSRASRFGKGDELAQGDARQEKPHANGQQ